MYGETEGWPEAQGFDNGYGAGLRDALEIVQDFYRDVWNSQDDRGAYVLAEAVNRVAQKVSDHETGQAREALRRGE